MDEGRFSEFIPTVAGAYSANNAIGGIVAFEPGTGPGLIVLKNLYVVDKSNQGAELMVHFFHELPAGPFTNQAAFAWGTGDVNKLVCSVEVPASAYKTQNAVAIANVAFSVGINYKVPKVGGIPKLYAAISTTGTPTFGAVVGTLRIDGYFLRKTR